MTGSTAQWQAGGATGPSRAGELTSPPVRFSEGGLPQGGFPEGGDGRGTGPAANRGKRGRVVASLIGLAVVLVAVLFAARHTLFGSPAANTASGGGATPSASSAPASRSSAASSSASASSSSASGAIGGAPGPAAGTATLTGVTTQVNAGSAPSFTYTAQDVSSGKTVVLQRTFGQTYENLMTLTGANGPVTAPTLAEMGAYSFRVAIESDGAVVSTSAPVAVKAYGTVQLVPFNNGNGTVQVGSRLFSYTDHQGSDTYPQYAQNQAWTSSTCRSITLQFTGDAQQTAEIVYLEFVQTSSDPAYASAPTAAVKSVTVPLDGGPLFLNTSSTNADNIDFTATGSCYTPSGQPQGS